MNNNLVIFSLFVILLSPSLQAGVGPESSWGELYQDRLHEPQVPVIPFYVSASTGIGGKLVLKKAHDLAYFKASDGRAWLYGGVISICTQYSVTGSLSDSRRQCLASEEVPLVRDMRSQLRYCTYRSDDDCQTYASREVLYSLEYYVPVMYRASESDSFTRARVAFSKILQIPECGDCARRLGF